MSKEDVIQLVTILLDEMRDWAVDAKDAKKISKIIDSVYSTADPESAIEELEGWV